MCFWSMSLKLRQGSMLWKKRCREIWMARFTLCTYFLPKTYKLQHSWTKGMLRVHVWILNLRFSQRLLFWNATPCCPAQVHRRFRETCCLDLQGRRVTQARNQQDADGPVAANQSNADIFSGLLCDTEYGAASSPERRWAYASLHGVASQYTGRTVNTVAERTRKQKKVW